MSRAALLALAPLAIVAGCAQSYGGVYQVPIDKAHKRLAETGLPPFVFGSRPPALSVRAEGPSRIVWIVKQNGAEIMRYVAELGPVGEGSTRVSLTLAAPREGRFGNVEQRLAENRSVRHLYLAAMEERIASALERRRFDMSRLYAATAAATAANIGEIGARFDRAAAADERRGRENIEKAYRDEAAGRTY